MSWICQYRKTVFTAVMYLLLMACMTALGVWACFEIAEHMNHGR